MSIPKKYHSLFRIPSAVTITYDTSQEEVLVATPRGSSSSVFRNAAASTASPSLSDAPPRPPKSPPPMGTFPSYYETPSRCHTSGANRPTTSVVHSSLNGVRLMAAAAPFPVFVSLFTPSTPSTFATTAALTATAAIALHYCNNHRRLRRTHAAFAAVHSPSALRPSGQTWCDATMRTRHSLWDSSGP